MHNKFSISAYQPDRFSSRLRCDNLAYLWPTGLWNYSNISVKLSTDEKLTLFKFNPCKSSSQNVLLITNAKLVKYVKLGYIIMQLW